MSSIQIGCIESFYLWDVFWFVVLKHFKHKNCLILIKIFKWLYDYSWTTFMLKMFQYLRSKCVSSGQNVSIAPSLYTTARPMNRFVKKLWKTHRKHPTLETSSYNFTKSRTTLQVFPWDFYGILQNSYCIDHLLAQLSIQWCSLKKYWKQRILSTNLDIFLLSSCHCAIVLSWIQFFFPVGILCD